MSEKRTMILNIDYKEAIELRNAGTAALISNLGEEGTAKFISLFNYYTVDTNNEDLLVKDYTEWRKTQPWYNDTSLEELLDEAATYHTH
jgi:hypothetical protein